ncbi:MAG TPA: murein biosynthesis integral membrane protein MurJ [Propionibacteriaceae bacterium]|nr:murein biosynthesis integral membrane protein MurJ [Propionibacteriaceae bacterium]
MSDTSTREPEATPSSTSKLISASALMAAGTLASRILGFARLMLLVVLFGNGTRQADMFTFANTVPNSMYILLAGGVLNTVLVPQIVRAIKGDADRGEAYTNRIMTAGLIALAAITVALTFAAPLIIRLFTPQSWHIASRAAQFDSMVSLAYYCLPQVFFYGVYVLSGQVLNARGRFGPMMWAPIANNVISILVLLAYLVVFGQGDRISAFTSSQELLLGLGSTLGIAAQAIVLVPFLRAAGYRFQPRLDLKDAGLGHTLAVAKWTLGFVLVTQAALVVIYRLAGEATAAGQGAGLTVYTNAYAVWILPHSLITVSLATAMLPNASRLAAAGDLDGVATEAMRTMRLAVTALLPTAVALFALGQPIAQLAFGFGRGAVDADLVGRALMALAFGLVPFTLQYVCLRAYYSLEDTRTTFFLQLLISGMHVGFAVAVVALLNRSELVATGLAIGYATAYAIGVVVSFSVLRRRLSSLHGGPLVRHCLRLLAAAIPAGLAGYAVSWAYASWSDSRATQLVALVSAGLLAVPVFLGMSRLLRIDEVNEIVSTLTRRRRRGGRASSGGQDSGLDPAGEGDDAGPPGDATARRASAGPTIDPVSATDPGQTTRPASHPDGSTETLDLMPTQPGATDQTGDFRTTAAAPEEELLTVPRPVAAAIPAGTVLAARYRLEELLAGSESTVTWRAFDQVLSRSVLVHLLPPRDPAAADLLSAARSASAATDSRFLRVLDAVYSDAPDLGSYIVCEYATGQSLEMILRQGPLSGLEAAWVVREVADALSGVHQQQLYHCRIDPGTVIITPTGNVKIVGLMIEAALRPRTAPLPGARTPELIDVLDLGRLLYAALVARWPGGPGYSMPAAPSVGRGWMTPRQVRAGVSPALDAITDQILGDPPRHHAPPLRTANGVLNALTKLLGTADAASDLERRLRQPVPQISNRPAPVSSLLTSSTTLTQNIAEPTPPRPTSSPAGATPAAQTEAGQTTVMHRPPAPVRESAGAARPGRLSAVDRQRRRVPAWLPLLLSLALLAGLAGLVFALIPRQLSLPGTSSGSSAPATTAQEPTGERTVWPIEEARDFDPQGDPNRENPSQVKYVYDGKPKTRWQTVTYYGNPRLGGLKRGVGVVLDLGQAQPVGSVKVALSGSGTAVEVRVPEDDAASLTTAPLSSDGRWRTVTEKPKVKKSATLALPEPVNTRFVLVYLTSLPKEGSGYRGGIYEVEVRS